MSNFLLIAGTNRNVGKTTFCCNIISKVSKQQEVWAIKITSHIHLNSLTCKVIYKSKELIISQELSSDRDKDSSKMLAAGASKVFFIQGADGQMPEVSNWINKNIPKDIPVVIESGALRHFIEPGYFVLLSKDQQISKHRIFFEIADCTISNFEYNLNQFNYTKNNWKGFRM